MIKKFTTLFAVILLMASCKGVVDIKLLQRSKALPTENDSGLASSKFTVQDVTLNDKLGGFSTTLNLSYTELNSLLATKCEVNNESKLSGSSCTCDVSGACSVSISGSAGKLGVAHIDYRVGDDSSFSDWAKIEVNLICPSGYLKVSSSAYVNSPNDFCVMRTEAKDVLGYPAVTNSGFPITGLDLNQAKSSCESLNILNSLVGKYNLIANEEWMNISRKIEGNASNWSNGVIDPLNEINRGHSDLDPYATLEISNENDLYDGTNNSSLDLPSLGWEQKRTHILEENQLIWDFSGNVWEWVDISIDSSVLTLNPGLKPYSSANGVPTNSYLELTSIDRLIGENLSDFMKPEAWQPHDSTLSHDQGIGQYYAGINSSGGSLIRGGAYFEGNRAGVYAFAFDQESNGSGNWLGFRCVFRP